MKAEDAKKIIATAIDREVEAYTFYRTVSDRVKDPALKSLFDELAGEEKKHRVFLEGFLAKDVGTMKFAAGHDYKVGDELPSPKLTVELKPLDGLVLAIKKELGSHADVYPVCKGRCGCGDPAALYPARKHGTGTQGTP